MNQTGGNLAIKNRKSYCYLLPLEIQIEEETSLLLVVLILTSFVNARFLFKVYNFVEFQPLLLSFCPRKFLSTWLLADIART